MIKAKLKKILHKKAFSRGFVFCAFFLYRHGYLPNVNVPRTFNEKINYRKRLYINEDFVICSDKLLVKKHLSSIIDDKYIIDTISSGDNLTINNIDKALEECDDIVVKNNHDSGSVFFLNRLSSLSEKNNIIDVINSRLKVSHGLLLGEQWYTKIRPQFLIEKRIKDPENDDLNDYKFHMFRREDGDFNIVVQVDFNRSGNHSRTLLDEELNWLPFHIEKPCIYNKVSRPDNYDKMLDIAKKLAKPFSYVRVDLYNINGAIYFGELTFSHGSGNEVFSSKGHDMWMGKLWELDPRV